MKAVYIAETGGPEKLIFGDRPDPSAGLGEVVIRVRASAVNHADLSIRSGRSIRPTSQRSPRPSARAFT